MLIFIFLLLITMIPVHMPTLYNRWWFHLKLSRWFVYPVLALPVVQLDSFACLWHVIGQAARATAVYLLTGRLELPILLVSIKIFLSQKRHRMCSTPTKCSHRFLFERLQCNDIFWANTFDYESNDNCNRFYSPLNHFICRYFSDDETKHSGWLLPQFSHYQWYS